MKLQQFSDKVAIGLSFLCVIHCLFLPVLLILIPPISGLMAIDDEAFHIWLLYAVIPISVIALAMGYLHHRNINVFFVGIICLGTLTLAALLGHDILGEYGEVILTVIGSLIIAFGHIRNYRLRCKTSTLAPHL